MLRTSSCVTMISRRWPICAAVGQHILGPARADVAHARVGRFAFDWLLEASVRSQQAGHEQLGHHLDDAAAADAGGLHGSPALLIRPVLVADQLEARLAGGPVDAHALDRARRGALAVRDLRALKGRAGRAAAAQQPSRLPSTISALVPTSMISVMVVLLLGRLGDQHAQVVRADMAGLERQQVNVRGRVQLDAQVARLDVERRVRGRA